MHFPIQFIGQTANQYTFYNKIMVGQSHLSIFTGRNCTVGRFECSVHIETCHTVIDRFVQSNLRRRYRNRRTSSAINTTIPISKCRKSRISYRIGIGPIIQRRRIAVCLRRTARNNTRTAGAVLIEHDDTVIQFICSFRKIGGEIFVSIFCQLCRHIIDRCLCRIGF